MSTGFVALGDDGIHATLFKPAGLVDSGGRTDDRATGSLDPPQQRGLRQPEMEAHDFRLDVLNNRAERRVECATVTRRHRRCRIDLEFAIIRRKSLTPLRFPLIVERRRRVAEKAEVDWLRRARADLAHLLAELIRV